MKRQLTGVVWLLACSGVAHAGSLQDLYCSKGLRLQPDASYAAGTDWQKAFSDYFEQTRTPMGNSKMLGTYKQLTVAPDGSVFVSNYGQYTIHKFDPSGKLVKTFGGQGKARGQFRVRPDLGRILGGRYLPVELRDGQIDLFDLDGNFVKAVKVDYPVYQCVGLTENRLALDGLILYGRKRPPKHLIVIKDIDTGREVEIRSSESPSEGRLQVKLAGGPRGLPFGPAFAKTDRFMAASRKGSLVSGLSNSPEVTVHSPEGRLLVRFDLKIQPAAVTEKQKQEYYDTAAKTFARMGLPKVALEALRDPGFFPPHLPYYYNLLVDSEDNILVFPYAEDASLRRFQVYTLEGKLVCESSLDEADFELNLNPRFRLLEFAGTSLFGVLPLKKADGVPLRVFRVDLAAQQQH